MFIYKWAGKNSPIQVLISLMHTHPTESYKWILVWMSRLGTAGLLIYFLKRIFKKPKKQPEILLTYRKQDSF